MTVLQNERRPRAISVGADDPVRPAVHTRKPERTPANPHNVCRGRCLHRPVRGTSNLTERCGKFAIAKRADSGVRPYRVLCVVAGGACNFAIAYCRGERGIDPYGHVTLSSFTVRFCDCILHGRGRTPPLRQIITSSRFTITSYLSCPASTLRLKPSPEDSSGGSFFSAARYVSVSVPRSFPAQ